MTVDDQLKKNPEPPLLRWTVETIGTRYRQYLSPLPVLTLRQPVQSTSPKPNNMPSFNEVKGRSPPPSAYPVRLDYFETYFDYLFCFPFLFGGQEGMGIEADRN